MFTFFQDLHRKGHEIGVFSITRRDDPKYWSDGSYDDWLAEMAGARLIVERFANITDGSVIGVRAPYLLVGANEQVLSCENSLQNGRGKPKDTR